MSEKPKIQELLNVMQKFQINSFCAMEKSQIEKWQEARKELFQDLDKLGIADKFNWEDE